MGILKRFVGRCEIDLSSSEKNRRFGRALSELISILFAVVFGVGLSQLGETEDHHDLFVLIIGYLAITLSWWGYHYGTIKGPQETNVLSYFIDVLIVVLYWFLINYREPLWRVALLYVIMFGLYSLWESIRWLQDQWKGAKDATLWNLGFTVFACVIVLVAMLEAYLPSVLPWVVPSALGSLVIVYRIVISHVYSKATQRPQLALKPPKSLKAADADLVAMASTAQGKALAKLSGYTVGAALLGRSGNAYVGCNIEFDNYSNTLHAEEVALAAGVVNGEREFEAIAVVTDGPSVAWPCGMCLQSLHEVGGNHLRVIAVCGHRQEVKALGELLPYAFSL